MMDDFYKKLSSYLIRNRDINEDDGELYEYAIKVVIQGATSIMVTFLIGIIFGMFKECLCFIFSFMILRKFTGGLHANRFIYCLLSSICLIVTVLFTIKYLENRDFINIFIYLNITSVILICVCSPADNDNKPLLNKEKNVYRLISMVLSITICVVSIFMRLKNVALYYSVSMGLITTSILLFICTLKNYLIRLVK